MKTKQLVLALLSSVGPAPSWPLEQGPHTPAQTGDSDFTPSRACVVCYCPPTQRPQHTCAGRAVLLLTQQPSRACAVQPQGPEKPSHFMSSPSPSGSSALHQAQSQEANAHRLHMPDKRLTSEVPPDTQACTVSVSCHWWVTCSLSSLRPRTAELGCEGPQISSSNLGFGIGLG